MWRDDPLRDPYTRARQHYFALRDECEALRREIARHVTSRGSPSTREWSDSPPRTLARQRARLAVCQSARDEAFHAFGRALLDRFASEVADMTVCTREIWRQGHPLELRDSAPIAESFRRGCLASLSRWPDLAAEAAGRLAPSPYNGRLLQ
jgi:hypothetical protein